MSSTIAFILVLTCLTLIIHFRLNLVFRWRMLVIDTTYRWNVSQIKAGSMESLQDYDYNLNEHGGVTAQTFDLTHWTFKQAYPVMYKLKEELDAKRASA
jgi:hypothetical protein